MSGYDNTNSGALFKENEKKSDSHPDFRGNIGFQGTSCWASGWVREEDGEKCLSLSFQQKDGGASGEGKLNKNPRKNSDRHPDYVGKCTFGDDGEFNLAGWKRTAKTSGKEFISIRVEVPQDAKPKEEQPVTAGVADDDIPF